MAWTTSRRALMRRCMAAGATAAVTGSFAGAAPAGDAPADAAPRDAYTNYFGDLHNHNQVGYAQGSLERTYEIARNHLDFFAFTPHAYWPDIGTYDGKIEHKWLNGFHVAKARWPEVVDLARTYDAPGTFVTILGYERHHTAEGDYHVLYPDLEGDYALIEGLADLQAFAKKRGCLLVPHHPANRLGHRGIDITKLDPAVSPVLEMFSEWGCAEHDRAPQPYKRHTEAARWTRNTLQYYLAQGHRLGVIASTDDHLGCPGGYREGLAVVKATDLTRPALFDALRRRRCYAVTGDRIDLDFYLNGSIMGGELPFAPRRTIQVGVRGWDVIDRVEVVRNGRVVHRDFPVDREPGGGRWAQPVVLRFEYGWGPWPALGWGGTADWDFTIEVQGGRIEAVQPCFAPGPLDEGRRDKVVSRSAEAVHVQSFTALKQQVDDYSQKAVVLRVAGGPQTRVTVACTQPTACSLTQTFAQLADSNEMLFTRAFPWESAMLHRLVFAANWETAFTFEDEGDGAADDWYYVRVVQANEQMAWSSPVWVNARGPYGSPPNKDKPRG
ncbi:MAG: DUF3604 domain-containing protein [Planctomycetes bacterium]|nr:DUF3604 domain-containing protein [Planctomycetota bacterium]